MISSEKLWDIIERKANISGTWKYRDWFKHVAVYLGRGVIFATFPETLEVVVVKKDTLKNFFNGETGHSVKVVRPIIRFKSKDKMIKDLTRAIDSEYGKYNYDTSFNNCEHFANMMVLGIKHSGQYHLVVF